MVVMSKVSSGQLTNAHVIGHKMLDGVLTTVVASIQECHRRADLVHLLGRRHRTRAQGDDARRM